MKLTVVSKEPFHARVITATAASLLIPMGLRRKGRSRTWLDDRAWWLGLVEFQPSSWSKGSYLNVGAMWLWNERPHLAYDTGGRVSGIGQGLEGYTDNDQWGEVTARLVEKAADEIAHLRQIFAEPSGCAAYYKSLGDLPPSHLIDAGIAFGLSGMIRDAVSTFARYLTIDDDRPFVLERKSRARVLTQTVRDPDAFRASLRSIIDRTRTLLGLPTLAEWLW